MGMLLMLGWFYTPPAHANETQYSHASSADSIIGDRNISARVLGGDVAQIEDWPSIVPLLRSFSTADLADRFYCGGTVVADRWVLTAAHCLYDLSGRVVDADSVSVVTGVNDLEQSIAPVEYVALRHYIHPDYDNDALLPPNDIALLEFSENLNATPAVLFAGNTEEFSQSLGNIAGWGATRYENGNSTDFPNLLQEATVPLVSNEVCNAPESYGGLILDTHLCAGFEDGLVDACAGDSGGPLTISIGGQRVQAGITSFGNGCGLPEFYGIYTNVSHYLPWLSQYIDVPEQSQSLVDERGQANLVSGDTNESLGSINVGLLLLLGYGFINGRSAASRAVKQ